MSRKKKNKPKSSTSTSPSWPRLRRMAQSLRSRPGKALLLVVLIGGLLSASLGGLKMLEHHVYRVRQASHNIRFHVQIANLPDWVPPTLARLVTRDLTPPQGMAFEDERLCEQVYRQARQSPWISAVHRVRRMRIGADRGRVDVLVDFRQPIARVRYNGRTYFVDAEGVILPYEQVPQWAARLGDGDRIDYYISDDAVPAHAQAVPIHYIVIDGVRSDPPKQGLAWQAADLQAGLRLVELVNRRPWANQITVVDVRNHDKRVSESEPELRMYAQAGRTRSTDIRFGRFPHPGGGDWVIAPDRKIRYLDEYAADHGGRLAGINSYIDVRYDELRVSIHRYDN